MVAVGVMKVGGEASFATINCVVGGVIVVVDGIAIGGVAGAVMVSGSSALAGEVVAHCTSSILIS